MQISWPDVTMTGGALPQLPVCAGMSVGARRTTGTAGLVVTEPDRPTVRRLLVNAHVVQDAAGWSSLYAPGSKDRATGIRAVVGDVVAAARLRSGGVNRLDAALIEPHSAGAVHPQHPLLGNLRGHRTSVRQGWKLVKCSRTTGTTDATVVTTRWRGFVRYRDGERYFADQVVLHNRLRPIALEGDSGAVWCSEDGYAVAMAFGGSNDGHYAFATPIARVLDSFGVVVAR